MNSLAVICVLLVFALPTYAQHRERDLDNSSRIQNKEEYRKKVEDWEIKQIDNIKNVTNPYLTPPSLEAKNPLKAYWWILEYDSPFATGEVFLIILWPMILGRLVHYLMKHYRPVITHKREEVPEFPLIPLAFLQATVAERQMKREIRNGLHWLAEKYIVIASDEYVNLHIGGKHYQQLMGINKKKPWGLSRRVVTLLDWWRRAQKRLELSRRGEPTPDSLLPIRLQRRSTSFFNLSNEEGTRRRSTASKGQAANRHGSKSQGSYYNPGVSKALSWRLTDARSRIKMGATKTKKTRQSKT